MIFFLIVPSVIVLTIFLVHRILNRLGVRIFYPTLAMCVVLSFLVDVLAAMLSPNPDKWYFLRLFALIFVAAAAVTALNKFLVDNENRHN